VTSPFVRLALTPDGEVNEEVAATLLERLTRPQLKRFLAALRQELKRRRVYVTVAGAPDPSVGPAVGEQYPGRDIGVEQDETLGAGVRISAGDDIVDASVRGYIREIIGDLEGT
jgi:F0F1-type ATP synthase delta subunit